MADDGGAISTQKSELKFCNSPIHSRATVFKKMAAPFAGRDPVRGEISDEDYLIFTARLCKDSDPWTAKAWMLTAKALFPQNFSIQYEAYLMASDRGNIKEAAKCLEELMKNFSHEPALWTERQKIAEAMRSDSKINEKLRMRELFKELTTETQHNMLLAIADHSEDPMEHCQLMLLLLNMFPQKISEHGVKLIDTLFAAEKHGHYLSPVNNFRQLLVMDVLPLILKSRDTNVPTKQMFHLLQKSVEFYVAYACQSTSPKNNSQKGPANNNSGPTEPWVQLFGLMECATWQCQWELDDLFSLGHSDEARWQRIFSLAQKKGLQFLQEQNTACPAPSLASGDDPLSSHYRQVFFAAVIVFLHSLYNFGKCLNPEWFTGNLLANSQFLLLECPPQQTSSDNPEDLSGHKHKRRKMESECSDDGLNLSVSVGAAADVSSNLTQSFTVATNCWRLLQSNPVFKKEFGRLSQNLQMETWPWFQEFYINSFVYQSLYQEAIHHILQLQKTADSLHIKTKLNLTLASCFWAIGNISTACDCLLDVICSIPEDCILSMPANAQNHISFSKRGRSLHFLKLNPAEILEHCVRMLTTCFKERVLESAVKEEQALGHLLVLLQYAWPKQEDLFLKLLDTIQKDGTFTYRLFLQYIINSDMLEEFMFLTTPSGGNVNLDILATPNTQALSKQRAVTRGVNRGAKEDLKMAMERQMCRCEESLEHLLVTFFKQERELIKQNLF